jgi:hypothetical protein
VSARPPGFATGSGSDQSLGDNRIGIQRPRLRGGRQARPARDRAQ